MAKLAPKPKVTMHHNTLRPTCVIAQNLRFCQKIDHHVYVDESVETLSDLDFRAHKVFDKIAPHMNFNSSEKAPEALECRRQFSAFLCLRNFPHCCQVARPALH